jgi:DNA-binding MarR family transcriptional regulator
MVHANKDAFHHALMDLVGILTRPQPDEWLLKNAGASLDRALFPLLVRIGLYGPIGIVELAELVGRDHSTVSRQVSKMETMGLVERQQGRADQRVREAVATKAGRKMVEAIGSARRRMYDEIQKDWSAGDRAELTRLVRKLADDMAATFIEHD